MVINVQDPAAETALRVASGRIERNWNSLHYLNLYRFIVVGVLLIWNMLDPAQRVFGQTDPVFFYTCSVIYMGLVALTVVTISLRRPRFEIQINFQIVGDIIMIVLMMAASGGVRSGLGLLLIVSLAFSGLVVEGRMVMFYAALATFSVLFTQMLLMWGNSEAVSEFGQAGLLGLVFFATAGVAHVLANRNRVSEALAAARAVDLENMAQINQLVIDDMQDGVVVLDGDGKIRQANQQAQYLLGRAGLSYAGMGIALHRTIPLLSDYLRQWRKNPQAEFPPISLGTHGEQYLPRFIAVTNRRVMGAVLVLEDMTRMNEQTQQIKLAALGRLTANIAHEIRNPLAAINHAAEILNEDHQQGQQRLLDIIINNSERINRLITDVMSLNRRDRMQTESIALASCLSDFVEEFCHGQGVASGLIEVVVGSPARISFDRDHLQQVLTNLCANALRHSLRQSGSVRIRVDQVKNLVIVHIFDDGKGVDPEHIPRLFEPFFTTEHSGTGLGLYISKELCNANGASLEYVPSTRGGHFKITSMETQCQNEQ